MNFLSVNSAILLIIDNDPLMLTAIAAILHQDGHECHCARDSEAALKAVAAIVPDLILCDTHLDDECGIELCGEIREQPALSDVPVVFMSSSRDPHIVQQTQSAGGCYYLSKPFDPNVLTSVVDKALWMPHLINQRIASHKPAPIQTDAMSPVAPPSHAFAVSINPHLGRVRTPDQVS